MAITTLAGIRSGLVMPTRFSKNGSMPTGVAGRAQSGFYVTGATPEAAAAPTPGLAGEALTSYAGQIGVPTASGTAYLAGVKVLNGTSGNRPLYLLCDRLWHNSGFTITSTSAQTVNSVAFPARDRDGSTNGDGVYIGVEVSTTTGLGTPTITVSYTNQAGTAGRTGTNIMATIASAAIGSFYTIKLQAGDTGVRSVQTLTLSATWTSGVIHLVAYRPIAAVTTRGECLSGVDFDYIHNGLIPVQNNMVPFLLYQGGATAPKPQLLLNWAQG